jgi:hypothetical protein
VVDRWEAKTASLAEKVRRFLEPVHTNGFRGANVFPARKLQTRSVPCEETASNRHVSTASMGDFFEALAAGLYGGDNFSSELFEDDHVRPDVFNLEEGILLEVKGSSDGYDVQLRDDQMNRLRRLQTKHVDIDTRVILFRHSFVGIKSFGKGSQQRLEPASWLYERLAGGPLYALDLDFLVADALHDPGSDVGYQYSPTGNRNVYNNDVKRYDHCMCLRPGEVRRLFSKPFDTLKELGFSELEVQHFYTPEGLSVDGVQVSPFPVISINVPNREQRIAERASRWESLSRQERDRWLKYAQDEAFSERKRLSEQGCYVNEQEMRELVQGYLPRHVRGENSSLLRTPQNIQSIATEDLPF